MPERNTSVIDKTRVPIRVPNKISRFVKHLAAALFDAVFVPKPAWKYLEKTFEMQRQSQSLWCWAAVAASVAKYYEKPQAHQRQCQIVKEFIDTQGSDCCNAPEDSLSVKSPCNKAHELHPVLYAYQCVGEAPEFDPAKLPKVYQEIDEGRPLCVRILWDGPGNKGHFVAIVGYNAATETLAVMDPDTTRWTPGIPNEYTYKSMCTKYAGLKGKWNQTFFTKNVPA